MGSVLQALRISPDNPRRTWTLFALTAVVAAALAAPAVAAVNGTKPSTAPNVVVGQQYFGTTHTGTNDTQEEYWHLPPLLAQDVIQLAWHVSGVDDTFATQVCLIEGADDYNYGSFECSDSNSYDTPNGAARSFIPVPSASTAAFLMFYKRGFTCCNSGGPYDFIVEAILHKIGVSLAPRSTVGRKAAVVARAVLTNGAAVPDGVVGKLKVSYHHKARTYAATSSGGTLNFRLALPRKWRGKRVKLVALVPQQASYQLSKAVPTKVKVK
jgi:hypothetical protein